MPTPPPIPWQNPRYGSDEHDKLMDLRSAVERSFSRIQDPHQANWQPVEFRTRGIVNVGLMLGFAGVIHNLRLGMKWDPDPPVELPHAA